MPWLVRVRDRRPDPEPLRTDDRRPVLVGILVWALLGAVGLLLRDRLQAAGDGWWLWTPPAGVALGLIGLVYLSRRARREAARGDGSRSPSPDPAA